MTGKPTQFITQAVDLSDRLHAEEELQRRIEQQSVVARLGQHALEGVESVRLLDEAAEAIADTLAVDLVGILELCEESEGMRLAAGHGFPEGMVRGPSQPMTDMHRAGLEQLRNGPLAFDDFASEHGPSDVLHRFGVKSSMSVLIGERAQPFGALGVYSRTPRHFNDLDASFVQSVANVLWNAIAPARVGAGHPPPGAARPADRPAQPRAVPRPPHAGARPGAPSPDQARRDAPRPRPLQAGQRQPRPPRRRRAAAGRTPGSPRRCAPRTPSRDSAVTSSWCSARTSTTAARFTGWRHESRRRSGVRSCSTAPSTSSARASAP